MAQNTRVRHRRLEGIGSVLAQVLKKRGWKVRIDHERAVLQWPELVGEVTAGHAKALRVTGNVLVVQTDSPAWTHTLTMMKPELLKRLRAAVPAAEIKDLRFFCGEESSALTIVERSHRWRKAPPRPPR